MDGLRWTSRRHWWGQVNNTLITFHLSETSGFCQARTWTTRLTDRDANHYAISPPPLYIRQRPDDNQGRDKVLLPNDIIFFATKFWRCYFYSQYDYWYQADSTQALKFWLWENENQWFFQHWRRLFIILYVIQGFVCEKNAVYLTMQYIWQFLW